MICNITKSTFYKQYCTKRKCSFYPCTQLIRAHRHTIKDVVIRKEAEG